MKLSKVQLIRLRLKELKQVKQPWLPHYQLVGEYINNRKQNFTERNTRGAFLTNEIFDNVASRSNDIMSSALIGALYPNGAQSIELLPARGIKDNKENKEYYEFAKEELISVMDHPRAGFLVALTEYMEDQGSFGLSGIYAPEKEDDHFVPIRYRAWDVKSMYIDENEDGFVDTVYCEKEMSILKAVKEYGLENLSENTREKFHNSKFSDTILIVHAIEPRVKRNINKLDSKNKPIASIHVEINANKIIREKGFDSMPVFIARFRKFMGEIQGRSPGMASLPDAVELGVIWETLTLAFEKQVDPPLGVLDDGALGISKIDTSAGAINVMNVSGRLGSQAPIFPIFTIGEVKSIERLIEKREDSITGHFYIDRLLDLNNDVKMTLGEAQIRNKLRGDSLGSVFGRQISELFTPIIYHTINVLLKRGRLGVVSGSIEEAELIANGITPVIIPDEIAKRMVELKGKEAYELKGNNVFDIGYISPAARAMQAEIVQGLFTTADFALGVSAQQPEILDNINFDKVIRKVAKLTGATLKEIEDMESVQKIREARAEQQKAMMELQAAKEVSEIAMNTSQAQATAGSVNGNINKN